MDYIFSQQLTNAAKQNNRISLILKSNDGYILPASSSGITINGATIYAYDVEAETRTTATLEITATTTDNVSITIPCAEKGKYISFNTVIGDLEDPEETIRVDFANGFEANGTTFDRIIIQSEE